jgi:hypothetical protein
MLIKHLVHINIRRFALESLSPVSKTLQEPTPPAAQMR